jgi:hypothetical protein
MTSLPPAALLTITMQLQITLLLIMSLFRTALAQDARPNFTDLLSNNAITADIVLNKLDDTLVFFDAAKHFYTKHYLTTDHFHHTKPSKIEERSTMAAIMNTTREFLLKILVNQPSDIDASDCEFGEYVAITCEEPNLPLEVFFGILIEKYLRTARCAEVIARILERQDTLADLQAQITWSQQTSRDPQEQEPSFWHDPGLQWQWQWAKNTHTEESQNPAQSDEFRERLRAFDRDLEVLDRAFWTSLQSNYARAVVERMYTTFVDANRNTKAMLVLLGSLEGKEEIVSDDWPAVEVYWATMCRSIVTHPPVASEDRGMVFMW